ncbi:MAG: hypothetical protein P8Y18_09460 [Candidatus Bathyarchaeota archaeon]
MFTTADLHDWMQYTNIFVQVSILLLILVSLYFKKKRKYVWHGNFMLLAVIINGLLLLSHMGPSLRFVFDEPIPVTILGFIHAGLGSFAEFFGIWIAGKWAFGHSETKYCIKKRNLMRITITLWIIALTLGLLYYYLHTFFE